MNANIERVDNEKEAEKETLRSFKELGRPLGNVLFL